MCITPPVGVAKGARRVCSYSEGNSCLVAKPGALYGLCSGFADVCNGLELSNLLDINVLCGESPLQGLQVGVGPLESPGLPEVWKYQDPRWQVTVVTVVRASLAKML